MITKYINEIIEDNTFNWSLAKYDTKFKFNGDGQGDFEESSFDATPEVVETYIRYCELQIAYAKSYLELIGDKK